MLRNFVFLCFFLIPTLAAKAGTANEKDARAIVDKAFRAMGGKEKLAAIRAAAWTAKGKFHGFGAGVDFTGTFAVEGVDKGRTELKFAIMGKKFVMITVINGD